MATVAKSDRTTTITLASATAGPFDLSFRLFDTDALAVYVNQIPRTDWTLSALFSDGFDDNASITFDDELIAGDVIVIDSDLFPRRQQDYRNSGGLVKKLNNELGRMWATLSDLRRDTHRSVRFLKGSPPVPLGGGDFSSEQLLGTKGGGLAMLDAFDVVSANTSGQSDDYGRVTHPITELEDYGRVVSLMGGV